MYMNRFRGIACHCIMSLKGSTVWLHCACLQILLALPLHGLLEDSFALPWWKADCILFHNDSPHEPRGLQLLGPKQFLGNCSHCAPNIPKITIVRRIGCRLNLVISFYFLSVFGAYGQRVVECRQAIDPRNLPLSGHSLLQKVRTLGWDTPPISITHFNKRCPLT